MKAPRSNIFHSISTRILLAILITGVFVNIVAAISMRIVMDNNPERGKYLRNHFRNYIGYLLADIELPPNPDQLAKMSQYLHFDVRIFHPKHSYATAENLPDLTEIDQWFVDKEHFRKQHSWLVKFWPYPIGRIEGRLFTKIVRDDYTLVFFLNKGFEDPLHKGMVTYVIVVLSLIVVILYTYIKHLIKPIHELKNKVELVGKGDFDQVVPIKGKNEFAVLAKVFNQMTAQVKEMMESKKRLLRDVSHELRSPLTRMKLATQMLSDNSLKGRLNDDIQEMEKMITDLLKSFQMAGDNEELITHKFDLIPIIEELVTILTTATNEITLIDKPERFVVNCNPEKSQIVIKNVLENALKYSSEAKRPVEIRFAANKLTIRDFGIGISSEDLKKVFEPFFRADRSRQRKTGGFGLGLHLCNGIMKRQNGSIEIASIPDEGTTVTLIFQG